MSFVHLGSSGVCFIELHKLSCDFVVIVRTASSSGQNFQSGFITQVTTFLYTNDIIGYL